MTRRVRLLAVFSWLGGAVSVLPFAEEWFGVDGRTADAVLLAALALSVALGFAIHYSSGLRRVVVDLAGPADRPARALVLVAVFALAGAATMLAATALLGSD